MPIGFHNPHEAQHPDFTELHFQAVRQPLVDDFNITHKQAVQHLTLIWQAQNALDRQEWDNQQEAENAAAREEQDQLCQQEEEHQCLLDEERELAKQEDHKKNRNKFLPYNKVPISATVPKLASSLALCKLKKCDYVELYHWTNQGLAEAEASTYSIDEDAFTLTQDKNGHHSFIPIAALKTKDTIIPDKDLTWMEFNEAAPCILQAMEERSNPTSSSGWPSAIMSISMNLTSSASALSLYTKPQLEKGGTSSLAPPTLSTSFPLTRQ